MVGLVGCWSTWTESLPGQFGFEKWNIEVIAQRGGEPERAQTVVLAFNQQLAIVSNDRRQRPALQRHPFGSLAPQVVGDAKIGEEAAVALPESAHAVLAESSTL